MATTQKRTFSLPAAQAKYIDKLVKSGGYASGSEVVRAGLRALKERDAAMEQWLREEVVPVYDAYQSDPSRTISDKEVFESVRREHESHKRKVAKNKRKVAKR
jgi:antitoxin ParD1/3/4